MSAIRTGTRVRFRPLPQSPGAAYSDTTGVVESVGRADGVDMCTVVLDDGSRVTVPTTSVTTGRGPVSAPPRPARSGRRPGALADGPWSEVSLFGSAAGGVS